jgi:hypothetical protein
MFMAQISGHATLPILLLAFTWAISGNVSYRRVFAYSGFMTATSCPQHRTDRVAKTQPLDTKGLESFNRDVEYQEENLIFKACWYVAPYETGYYKIRVFDDGRVVYWHEVPDWAIQSSGSGKLSDALVEMIQRQIELLDVNEYGKPTEIEYGKTHTAFVFFRGSTVIRMDFAGDLPKEIGAIIEEGKSGLQVPAPPN